MTCPHQPRRAFTLIELLVVIAIIALLLSITMTALSGAAAESNRVVCLTNLREVHRASIMYAKDNDNVTVRGQWKSVSTLGSNDLSYSDLLMPYLVSNPATKPNGAVEDGYYENLPVFECPSSSIPDADLDASNGQRLDYGINNYGRYNNTDTDLTSKYLTSLLARRLDEVANHTTIYFCDVDSDWDPEVFGGASRDASDTSWPIYNSISRNAIVRHRAGYNVVQLDGAATWYLGAEPNLEAFLVAKRYVNKKIAP